MKNQRKNNSVSLPAEGYQASLMHFRARELTDGFQEGNCSQAKLSERQRSTRDMGNYQLNGRGKKGKAHKLQQESKKRL